MMADAKRLRKRQDAHLKAPSHLHLYLRKTDDALLYSRRHQLAGLRESQIPKDRRSHLVFPVDDELENCELPLFCPLITMRGGIIKIAPGEEACLTIKVGRVGDPPLRVGTRLPRWLLVASFIVSGVPAYSETQTPPKKA